MKSRQATISRKLTVIVFFCVITLVLGNLLVTNILATSGERLRSLSQRKEKLTEQNASLKMELLRLSSLRVLETRAANLGLTKSIQTLSVSSQPIAMYQ